MMVSSLHFVARALLLQFIIIISGAQAQQSSNRKQGPAAGPLHSNSTNPKSTHLPAVSIALGVLSVIAVATALLLAALIYMKKRFWASENDGKSTSSSHRSSPAISPPVQFTLRAMVAATNNFSDKIGAGLLGSVYKGLLPDNNRTAVAVKKLETTSASDKDFRSCITEVASLSPHKNLVKLYGYCAEAGAEKMIVYEFLLNGSLDKLLFEGSTHLDWNFRYDTALSVARGLAYLHQQQIPVVHGNVKTENILLDGSFHAKISDTALSMLVDRNRITSALSNGQGVHSYFSPEWIADSPLTTKSDVYGFGTVLLEIIGGRRIIDLSKKSEQWNFLEWASRQVKLGNYADVIDPQLKSSNVAPQQLKTAIDVALCCIQDEARSRPSMTKVVQMLEQNIPLAATTAAPAPANSNHKQEIQAPSV